MGVSNVYIYIYVYKQVGGGGGISSTALKSKINRKKLNKQILAYTKKTIVHVHIYTRRHGLLYMTISPTIGGGTFWGCWKKNLP